MQYYKGDEVELKFYNSASPLYDILSTERTDFFDDAYNCYILGEIIYDSNRSPLANAIPRNIFRESFSTIFDAFLVAGSFESYLTVFRKIFGSDVDVQFTVPGAGQLTIEIEAVGVELSDSIARVTGESSYVYYEMVTQAGENIAFQSIKGFTSEYDLKQMLFEMVPDGIYTTITLELG